MKSYSCTARLVKGLLAKFQNGEHKHENPSINPYVQWLTVKRYIYIKTERKREKKCIKCGDSDRDVKSELKLLARIKCWIMLRELSHPQELQDMQLEKQFCVCGMYFCKVCIESHHHIMFLCWYVVWCCGVKYRVPQLPLT